MIRKGRSKWHRKSTSEQWPLIPKAVSSHSLAFCRLINGFSWSSNTRSTRAFGLIDWTSLPFADKRRSRVAGTTELNQVQTLPTSSAIYLTIDYTFGEWPIHFYQQCSYTTVRSYIIVLQILLVAVQFRVLAQIVEPWLESRCHHQQGEPFNHLQGLLAPLTNPHQHPVTESLEPASGIEPLTYALRMRARRLSYAGIKWSG